MTTKLTAALHPHPSTPCPALHAIEVEIVRRADGGIALDYRLHGKIARLRMPEDQAPGRTDQLWQHTCCEAFLAPAMQTNRYLEFNFSPSQAWAAYAFSAIRQRDQNADPKGSAPTIQIKRSESMLSLSATLPAALLPAPGPLAIGLSAVIESIDGDCAYWALRHLSAAPDFHQRASFALTLDFAP